MANRANAAMIAAKAVSAAIGVVAADRSAMPTTGIETPR
jgi:hypothetical protein